jgi:hypothetical protein
MVCLMDLLLSVLTLIYLPILIDFEFLFVIVLSRTGTLTEYTLVRRQAEDNRSQKFPVKFP